MIRILIVEDNAAKSEKVAYVIRDMLGDSSCRIECEEVYVNAMKRLGNEQYDLLVLDLLIPRSHGDDPTPELSQTILKQIASARVLPPKYVVGLTAYEEERANYDAEFQSQGWRLVHFDPGTDEWETSLRNIVIHVAQVCEPKSSDRYDYDVAVITALADVEQNAVLQLDADWVPKAIAGDDALYHEGRVWGDESGRDLRLVTASASRMGMPATTALSMKMINNFRPKCIFMVGIAAGVSGRFGDVLIADQSWDYGGGKRVGSWLFGERFEPAPEAIPLCSFLRTRLAMFRSDETVVREIRSGWTAGDNPEFSVRIGAMASGAAVLQNRRQIRALERGQRKLVGVEMEAYGVFMAAECAVEPKPMACCIKSICDFGDLKKNDAYQRYAAYTSATFLFRFIQRHL